MGASQSNEKVDDKLTYDDLEKKSSKYLNELKTSGLLKKFIEINNSQYPYILYDIFQDSNILDKIETSYFIDNILPALTILNSRPNANAKPNAKPNANMIAQVNAIKKTICLKYKFSNWNNIYKKLITNKTILIKKLDTILEKITKIKKDENDLVMIIKKFKTSQLFRKFNIKDDSLYLITCNILKNNTKMTICEISYLIEYIIPLLVSGFPGNLNTLHQISILQDEYTYVNIYNILQKILKNETIINQEIDKLSAKPVTS